MLLPSAFSLRSAGRRILYGQFGNVFVELPLKISDSVAKSCRLIDPSKFRSEHAHAAEEDGDKLTSAEVVSNCVLLLFAGHETTTNLIANGVLALLDHPDQMALLRREPARMPAAIEEFLRFESPIPGIGRALTDDVRLHGEDLRKGQRVMLYFGAANRDASRYESPNEFDIFRKQKQHMAFAFGPHRCLGMNLARLETEVLFDRIFSRLKNLRLDPAANDVHITGRGFRSPRELPVLFG